MLAPMFNFARAFLSRLGMDLLRLVSLCAGAYFAGVYPAELWAEERRAANLAAHHVPNMEPGVLTVIALVLVVPILVLLLVSELTRVWALKGRPLSLPAAAVLGAAAAAPLGYGIVGDRGSNTELFLASALCIAAFYAARRTHGASRMRGRAAPAACTATRPSFQCADSRGPQGLPKFAGGDERPRGGNPAREWRAQHRLLRRLQRRAVRIGG